MDKDTRYRIQRATQAARELLEHEYAEQLEGMFDIRLDGTIAAEPGEHLDATQRVLRRKLITAVEHQRTSGMSKAYAVESYLREAAFTTLNRFVAMKMLEARELVQECISRGDQSAGFKEFIGLAPGLVQLTDHGYRVYIESIFDEIGREVRVLFDRRDPASLLWPRRQGLLDLLGVLNASELGPVWGEDETIGWVYQYFNSDDDRQRARHDGDGKPKPPQDSYELAVRNQFFTPRHIVRFLTDNTLGRMWLEMRCGDTRLRSLEYLLHQPNEVFLAEGEELTELRDDVAGDQEQNTPFEGSKYVSPRPKKDPRALRILDPACGSGHFLLYAFELLLTIYEEAWADDASPIWSGTERTLRADYPDLTSLRMSVPGLVLRHNLYGIDIDPRCAQIAALALWMRAQRAHRDWGVERAARPNIERTNIVVAEPMPGGPSIRQEFVVTISPDLGQLVADVFGRMELAGEAGFLLPIEQVIRETVRERLTAQGPLFHASDEARWDRVEEELIVALKDYSHHIGSGGVFQRRLFADDAVRGLGFLDACGRQYDVVLMNPPFGDGTDAVLELLGHSWPNAKRNLYIGFVYRALELLQPQGLLGAITDATFIHQTRYKEFRRDLVDCERLGLRTLVANGWGVLDAYVETACLVCGRDAPSQLITIDVRDSEVRGELVSEIVEGIKQARLSSHARFVERDVFGALPKSVLAFWLPSVILNQYREQPILDPAFVDARCGMSSSDNPRFYKVWWEVDLSDIGDSKTWRFLANGGPPCPLFRQQVYVVKWGADGRETKSRVAALYGSASRTIINEPYYFRAGLTFGKRTNSFTSQFLPQGGVFSNEGQAIFPHDLDAVHGILAYLNTSMVAYLLNSIAGQHKEAGYVGSIPAPPQSFLGAPRTTDRMSRAHRLLLEAAAGVPESQVFHWPLAMGEGRRSTISGACARLASASDELQSIFLENDEAFEAAIGIVGDERMPWESRTWRISKCIYETDDNGLPAVLAADYVGYLLGLAFGRWRHWDNDVVSQHQLNPLNSLNPSCPAIKSSDGESSTSVLVDDPGHDFDVSTAIELAHKSLVAIDAVAPEELEAALRLLASDEDVGAHFIKVLLFQTHLDRYSKSRRKAPIYWQLGTPTASYSVWLYYHRLTRDTLYRVQSDRIGPKLQHEERKLASLAQDIGTSSSPLQRKHIAAQENLISELRSFQEEIGRVASLWNPSLNDGVIINFAPLWRLVPQHRAWQKECKTTWDNLCNGDYDWAHLAMHLWPERVVPKCAKDRSLASAHGLDDVFWHKDSDGKWQPQKVAQPDVDNLVKERTSAAVKDALKSLIEAPAPTTGHAMRKKTPRAKGTRKRTASARSMAEENGASSPGRSSAAVDAGLLGKVKQAIAANGDGASKADVIDATGIIASDWNKAIKALLVEGSVTQTGERRGARYQLAGGEA